MYMPVEAWFSKEQDNKLIEGGKIIVKRTNILVINLDLLIPNNLIIII